MKKSCSVLVGTILLVAGGPAWCPVAHGQGGGDNHMDLPLASTGDLRFFVDTASFRGPRGYTRQEVYVLLDASQLEFEPQKKQFVGQMELKVTLTDSEGATAVEETWTRSVSVKNADDVQVESFPFHDIIGFDLKPGMYRLALTVTDVEGEITGTGEGAIRVHSFEGTELKTSDILCASEVKGAEREGRFYKNGWWVVPNTTRSYLVGDSLRVYFEVYNLADSSGSAGARNTFILGYSLLDTTGTAVRSYPPKQMVKPGRSAVKTEVLGTDGLAQGVYYVQAEVLDRDSRAVVRTRRMVFMSAPGQVPEGPVELTQEQKDNLRYFADIRYVAKDSELKVYDNLKSREEKRRFLRKFWKSLDPTPATPENERLVEHIQRMRYAENNFAAGRGKRGSDTDKGRIYIKYGPPSDIQYNLAASNTKPFEVWTYEHLSGARFIFMDRRGAGVFELVHSTHRNEYYNPDWRSLQ